MPATSTDSLWVWKASPALGRTPAAPFGPVHIEAEEQNMHLPTSQTPKISWVIRGLMDVPWLGAYTVVPLF